MEAFISVIIPTRNEEESIYEMVSRCKRALAKYDHEIIVVDHSEDDTPILAEEAGAKVFIQKERGVGAAMIQGASICKGNIIAFIDGDSSYQPEDLPKLIDLAMKDSSDIVNGDRFNGRMERGAMKPLNYFGNKLLTFIINLLFGTRISDSQSGMKVMKKEVYQKLNLSHHSFPIHSEICAKAGILKLNFRETPISYKMRRGDAKLNPFKEGLSILLTILRLRIFS